MCGGGGGGERGGRALIAMVMARSTWLLDKNICSESPLLGPSGVPEGYDSRICLFDPNVGASAYGMLYTTHFLWFAGTGLLVCLSSGPEGMDGRCRMRSNYSRTKLSRFLRSWCHLRIFFGRRYCVTFKMDVERTRAHWGAFVAFAASVGPNTINASLVNS